MLAHTPGLFLLSASACFTTLLKNSMESFGETGILKILTKGFRNGKKTEKKRKEVI